ncbi:MAG: hypothetical protein ACRDZY_22625, partial [Acidimicrobiales bacterium]
MNNPSSLLPGVWKVCQHVWLVRLRWRKWHVGASSCVYSVFDVCCPLPCRLHKLQQKHEQRQKLAQRAQAAAEAEIAWDDDTPRASPAASPQKPEHAPAQKVSISLSLWCTLHDLFHGHASAWVSSGMDSERAWCAI